MPMSGWALVAAVLALFPVMSGNNRACIEDRHDSIARQVDETARAFPTVRPEVMVAVAFSETHLGCDAGEGGGWGAPIDRHHRHTAGTHLHAAAVLARSMQVCGGDELSAVRRFRTGLCDPRRQSSSALVGRVGERYGRRVLALAERLSRAAGGR
jgi:hypothetical protein